MQGNAALPFSLRSPILKSNARYSSSAIYVSDQPIVGCDAAANESNNGECIIKECLLLSFEPRRPIEIVDYKVNQLTLSPRDHSVRINCDSDCGIAAVNVEKAFLISNQRVSRGFVLLSR